MTQTTSLKPHPTPSYVLGRSDAETRRLMLQHQIYGPITLEAPIGAWARMRYEQLATHHSLIRSQ